MKRTLLLSLFALAWMPLPGQIVQIDSVRFPDAGRVVPVDTTPQIESLDAFTVSMRIEYEQWGDNFATFVNKAIDDQAFESPWGVFKFSRRGLLDIVQIQIALADSSEVAVRSVQQIPPGRKTHLAATYDGSILVLYVDGQIENAQIYDKPLLQHTGAKLYLGGANANPDHRFDFTGTITGFKLFNTALSAGEVKALFEQTVPEPRETRKILTELRTIASGGGLYEVIIADTVFSRHTTERIYYQTIANLALQYPQAEISGRRDLRDRVERTYEEISIGESKQKNIERLEWTVVEHPDSPDWDVLFTLTTAAGQATITWKCVGTGGVQTGQTGLTITNGKAFAKQTFQCNQILAFNVFELGRDGSLIHQQQEFIDIAEIRSFNQ